MKKKISKFLRTLGLIRIADYIHYLYEFILSRKENVKFKKENPDVILPPDYMMYESFQLNYQQYYTESIETAKWLLNYFRKYQELKNIKILDWGCGPARIIRHFPFLVNNKCEFYGTDYNPDTIEWCKKNIPGITFDKNELAPPMKYENDFFDIIYGISVFTHLSEELHYKWFNELIRVTKPGGVILLTLHGAAFRLKLTDEETKNFYKGELIIKSRTRVGHRTFGAFHPPAFIKRLTGQNNVLEHIPGEIKNGKPQQDVWIIQKSVN